MKAVAPRPRGNVPTESLRWTIERAGGEFKTSTGTLRKNLRMAGIEPDATGCYSTPQIVAALYSDLHMERVQKERELVRRYRLENEATEGSLVNKEALAAGFAQLADAMVCRIMASGVPLETKEDLLRELSSIPIIISDVADKQTKRRPRRTNGETEEE
jgi:hypothetical protein